MPKINLPRLGAGMGSVDLLNSWAERVEDAIDNTVSRDGSTPNQMEGDVDLNDNYLLNVANPVNEGDGVNLRSVRPLVQQFAAEITETVVFGSQIEDKFTSGAGQQDFVLSESPALLNNTHVYVDGVYKAPTTDYTLTGASLNTIHFLVGQSLNAKVSVRYARALPTGLTDAANLNYTSPSTSIMNTLKVFLDSLWTAGSATGAALVRFIQGGGSAQATTMQDKGRERVSVGDFLTAAQKVEIQTGTGDHTAAFVAAAARCAATGASAHLHIPKGIYNISSPINILFSGVISGEGTLETRIKVIDDNINAFNTIGSFGQVVFRDLCIEAAAAFMTAGAGIYIDTTAPTDGAQQLLRVYNCRFQNLWRGVEIRNASYWVIDSCAFYDTTIDAIFSDCTDNFDAGDNTIVNCLITGGTSGSGIRLINNCRVLNNKILGHEEGIYIEPNSVAGTRVDFQVIGNSVENQTSIGIHMRAINAGTGIANCVIGQNQVGQFEDGAECIALHGPVGGVSVNNNVCVLGGINEIGISTVGNGLGAPGTIIINDNIITGNAAGTTGIFCGSTDTIVDNNLVQAAATKYNLATAGTTIRNTAFVFATLPANAANGSVVYCADGTVANPVAGGGTGCIAKRLNGVWVGN